MVKFCVGRWKRLPDVQYAPTGQLHGPFNLHGVHARKEVDPAGDVYPQVHAVQLSCRMLFVTLLHVPGWHGRSQEFWQ